MGVLDELMHISRFTWLVFAKKKPKKSTKNVAPMVSDDQLHNNGYKPVMLHQKKKVCLNSMGNSMGNSIIAGSS